MPGGPGRWRRHLFLAGPAPLAAVAGLAAVNGAAAALFLPAARGVVPQLIPAEQLQPGNALLRLSRNSASIAGAALAGLLLAVADPGWALAGDAASFLPPFFLLAASAPVWLIAASMLVNGVCVDVFEVLWDTSLQRHVPPGLLSRITSYDLLGSFALGPLGPALAGPAAAAAGLAATLTGAGVLLAAASVVPLLSREVRDLPASPAGAAPGTVGSVAG